MDGKHLVVPYAAQCDNSGWYSDSAAGNTQCNATSHTMLLMYLIPDFAARSQRNGFAEPEDYFKSKLKNYTSNRGDHDGFTRCLEREFAIVSQWRYDLVKQDLIDSLDASIPMTLGFQYKTSGHIVIATGYDDQFGYINDPYGIRQGTEDFYAVINPGHGDQDGKNDRYSWNSLNTVLFEGGGWGRVIQSLNGQSTGLQSLLDRKPA